MLKHVLFCPQHILKYSIIAEFDWWVKFLCTTKGSVTMKKIA